MNPLRAIPPKKQRQHGAALMVMLVILILGITTMLVSSLSKSAIANARQEKTSLALAQAKEALIGYAISSENSGAATARPGNFPCPDTVGDGNEQPSCSAAGETSIGRLPWKSLGLPELFDGDGEPLWYAISDNFRKIETAPVNSDTLGTLLVYDSDAATLLTPPGSEAVAIVFSPGNIVGSQQRNDATQRNTSSNYLDSASSVSNATVADTTFIAADISDSFNDRMIMIRTRDFMPIIEKRVAKELKSILANYRTNNGSYPYPAPFNTCENSATCTSSITTCRGRLPSSALPVNWGSTYALPAVGASNWFVDNKWNRVIYYSVGTSSLATVPASCSPTLDISGNSADALFFMPGIPLGGVSRSYPNSDPTLYLEDVENQDLDDSYLIPTTIANDQLYVLP